MANINSGNANSLNSPERTLRALAMELKRPLVSIARRAELGGDAAANDIIVTAEQTLALIDSYLLIAQTEYGQVAMDLEPLGLGSVLHEISYQIRPRFSPATTITVDDRAQSPVMTNRQALKSMTQALVDILAEDNDQKDKQLTLRSYKSKNGSIGVGVFTNNLLLANDINKALELQGRAVMPLARVSSRSGVSLAIADCLCRAIGGSLEVKRMGSLFGLATLLPKSEQLSLV